MYFRSHSKINIVFGTKYLDHSQLKISVSESLLMSRGRYVLQKCNYFGLNYVSQSLNTVFKHIL